MIFHTLEDLLQKVSLQSLLYLSGITQDPLRVQEAVEKYAFTRPTLGVLQILDSSYGGHDYFCTLKFGFSTKFMHRNQFLGSIGRSDLLVWLLKIHPYDFGDDPTGPPEEGLDNWLSRSKVEICVPVPDTDGLIVSELRDSIFSFEG